MDAAVINVPAELFAPAESSRFQGETTLAKLDAGPDVYTFDAPLSWQADVTNTGDALLVSGTVKTTARTACARCLEDVSLSLEGEIEGYFLIDGDAEGPEDMDDDEFDVLPESKAIDMMPLLEAALLVEVPLVPLCDDDCRGLCPQCGANLNEGDCGCAPVEDAGPENPFAVLKGLTFDKE